MGSGRTGFRLNHLHCATVLGDNAPCRIICLEALFLSKGDVSVLCAVGFPCTLLHIGVVVNLGLH